MARLAWIIGDGGNTVGAVAWTRDDFRWTIDPGAPQATQLERFWGEVERFAYSDPYFPRQRAQAGRRFECWMLQHGDGHLTSCVAVEAQDRTQLEVVLATALEQQTV